MKYKRTVVGDYLDEHEITNWCATNGIRIGEIMLYNIEELGRLDGDWLIIIDFEREEDAIFFSMRYGNGRQI